MRSKRNRMKNNEQVWGYVFIAPWLIGFFVFFLLPMVMSLIISFFQWDTFSTSLFSGFGSFVGFKNYFDIITSLSFPIATFNTLIYTFFSTLIGIIFGLLIAYVLVKKSIINNTLRTIIYLPSLVVGVAFSMMMMPIFEPGKYSLLNQILLSLGLKDQAWLTVRYQAVWVMVIMSFWGLGGSMIVFIAGFKNIDPSLLEAAKIDGANELQIFWKINIPLLIPVIAYQGIMGIIYGMQVFDLAIGLAASSSHLGMGLNDSLATLVYYLYRLGFKDFQMDKAAALGWIIFVITGIFGIILLLTLKRSEKHRGD